MATPLRISRSDADESIGASRSVVRRLSTLDRFLPVWIFAAMALGLALGRGFPGLGALLDRVQVAGVSVPIGIGLLWMMYPVLAKVRYETIGQHVANGKLLGTSLVLQLDPRAARDVRAGVADAARSAGIPERPRAHRPRPLHRHGAHLELARVWLRRARGGARCAQLGVPDPDLQRAGLALPHGRSRLVRRRRRRSFTSRCGPSRRAC